MLVMTTTTTTASQSTMKPSYSAVVLQNHVTLVVVVIVVAFVLLHLPSELVYLYRQVYGVPSNGTLFRVVGETANLLAALARATNFLVFCAASRRFRLALATRLRPWPRLRALALLCRLAEDSG